MGFYQFQFKMGTTNIHSKLKFFEIFEKIFKTSLRKISENFENYFGKFERIISRNSLEIIEKYFGSFIKIKSFRQISKIISKNFGKLPEIFLEISKNIDKI